MSNASLKRRLQQECQRYREGTLSLSDLSKAIEIYAEAFEAIAYKLVREFRTLAYEVELAHFSDEEDCDVKPDVDAILQRLDSLLSQVPD